MGWDGGGVFEVPEIPQGRTYVVATQHGQVALRIEINGDLFPVQWHAAVPSCGFPNALLEYSP